MHHIRLSEAKTPAGKRVWGSVQSPVLGPLRTPRVALLEISPVLDPVFGRGSRKMLTGVVYEPHKK